MRNKLIKISLSLLLAFIVLPSSVFADDEDIAINETNFPDAVFRKYVEDNVDKDSNKILSKEEINSVESIELVSKNISDLTGIEYFTNLTDLNVKENHISSLNLSKNTKLVNANIYNNEISSINVSNNTELKYLNLWWNRISSIDVSNNPKLEYLDLNFNFKNLKSLDISNNLELKELYCNHCNLSEIDLSTNIKLTNLEVNDNKLSSIDLSKNTKLTNLEVDANNLSYLDVSNNVNLEYIACEENKLAFVDVTGTKVNDIDPNMNYHRYPSGQVIDVSTIKGFDISKVSNVFEGQIIDGAIVAKYEGGWTVEYDYDCGNNLIEHFRITTSDLKYTVEYNTNGAKEVTPINTNEYDYEDSFNLSDVVLSKDGHTFKGWRLGDKVYQPGEEITLDVKTILLDSDGTLTFNAIWESTSTCGLKNDKNCDGVVTCEEEKGQGWSWNDTKKVCEFKGSTKTYIVNTATK